MAKGELTILRLMRITDILKAEVGEECVTCNVTDNTVTITAEGGTVIVLKPVSITPVY
jgi:hypothetical protein